MIGALCELIRGHSTTKNCCDDLLVEQYSLMITLDCLQHRTSMC